MKKQKFILTAVVALGLCFSVGAATGVKISAELKNQPMQVNGTSVTKEVITYNNTTYVPLRQVGEMLGASVGYQDGIVVLEGAQAESSWAFMGSEEEPYYVNTKLNVELYIIDDYDDGVPLDTWLETVKSDEKIEVKSKSMEKAGDMDVAYMNITIDGYNQIQGHIVYEGIWRSYTMYYADNKDAASLKKELLQAIAEDF